MARKYKIKGLTQKKNEQWVYKRYVPTNLVDFFPTETNLATDTMYFQVRIKNGEYLVNLDTKNEETAAERHSDYAIDFDERKKIAQRLKDKQPKVTNFLPPAEIHRLINKQLGDPPDLDNTDYALLIHSHSLTGLDESGVIGDRIAREIRQVENINKTMCDDISAPYPQLDFMLKNNGLVIPSGSPLYRQLKVAWLEKLKQQSTDRMSKLVNTQPEITEVVEHIPNQGTEETLTLGEVMHKFFNDPRKERRQRTIEDYTRKLKIVFRCLGGEGRLIGSITKKECEAVRDSFMLLTPLFNVIFKDQNPHDIAVILQKKRAKGDDIPKLDYRTANTYTGLLGSIFVFAEEKEYIKKNVASKLQLHKPRDQQKKVKEQFTTAHLQTIFAAPVFAGYQIDTRGRWKQPGQLKSRGGRFWVLCISLHTGMRLNECCQLLVSDIENIDGYPCIKVSEFDGQGKRVKDVKNEQSNRFIVVHPTLLELGFMKFVEDQKIAGEVRLFPEIGMSSKHNYSDTYQKWFNDRFIKETLGIYGPTFHSTRHAYADLLRDAAVPEAIQRALGGWASHNGETKNGEETTSSLSIYGRGYHPRIQLEHIQKVKHDVDWAKLIYTNDEFTRKLWK